MMMWAKAMPMATLISQNANFSPYQNRAATVISTGPGLFTGTV